MRAALYYFSGTGNTWRTANLYAAGLQRSGWETEVMAVEAALRDGLMPAADCLGLGFPVYAFGPPRVVDRFLPTLPPGRGRPAFVWAVAGGIVGGATAIVCDRLEANGYRVVHERAYAVPENGHWRWSKPAVAAMAKERAWSRIEALVACAADELATGRVRRARPGHVRRGLMSGGMWRWYMRSCAHAGRYIGVTAACRSCGLCAAACPTSAMPANPLAHRVGSECTFCLRCASICPRQAVTIRLLPKVIGILHRHLEPGYADVIRAIDKAAAP
ncbi:MAG TPA: EFR1 family ferrodoxin [Bacillota bacterium]|nr:EFR1 family ferrodoxin [Bacillota bacterium]